MSTPTGFQARGAGIVLIGLAILMLLVMLHHPVADGRIGPDGLASKVAALAGPARAVHGTMIAFLVTLLFALVLYSRRRGLDRPLVIAGLTFYSAGTFLMLIPPVIDGFVLPGLAERATVQGVQSAVLFPQMMGFGLALAITLAKAATVLLCAGILWWSVDLLRERPLVRSVGLVGVIVGVAPAALVLSGHLPLTAAGMTTITASWCIWYLALGTILARRIL